MEHLLVSHQNRGKINSGCVEQILQACRLPIEGILALRGAVCPYAVGVDIACQISLSVLDIPVTYLRKVHLFKEALDRNTRFGENAVFDSPKYHPVMDEDWNITKVTRKNKDIAWKQLGTGGSGNHFVDVGILTIPQNSVFYIPAGQYVAIMSHFGSRSVGTAVSKIYSKIAQAKLPKKFSNLKKFAWLNMDSEDGHAYWEAMQLMGRYAQANHHLIHKALAKELGTCIVAHVENCHNFAWQEIHAFEEVVVHRKGAIPAHCGVLGVILGSETKSAYIVRGKGNSDSLCSALHKMNSSGKIKEMFESFGVYKPITAQADLAEFVAIFQPQIVKQAKD